jgi:hypothetical protein
MGPPLICRLAGGPETVLQSLRRGIAAIAPGGVRRQVSPDPGIAEAACSSM